MHWPKPSRLAKMGIRLALLTALPGCALIEHNFRVVATQEFYRSGQMPADCLEETIQAFGIQTIISLRDPDPEADWHREELAMCRQWGVAHHDLGWSMNALPTPASLAEYVDLLRTAERPILVHCQGGVHRSGVASAVFILFEGGDIGEARGQLGPLFGEAPIGALLDLYEIGGLPFEQWVEDLYPAQYLTQAEGADSEADSQCSDSRLRQPMIKTRNAGKTGTDASGGAPTRRDADVSVPAFRPGISRHQRGSLR